jgi:hypothetical protein
MTEGTQEASDFVRAQLEKLKASRALYFAAKETMVDVSNRVWGEGKLTDGSKIKYNENYELWAYTPPSPKKVTGKGKPYEDWLIRPESISERKSALEKSIRRNEDIFRRTGSISAEIRGENASAKLEAFKKRFGKKERKIKGGWYKSYLSYKKQQGRDDLPFELTGRFRKAYFSGSDTPASLNEVSNTESVIFLKGENGKKYEGLTERKGKFLQLNEAEKEAYRQRIINLLAE